MEIDVKAAIKKQEAELLLLAAVRDKLNAHLEKVNSDMKECAGAIKALRDLEPKKEGGDRGNGKHNKS